MAWARIIILIVQRVIRVYQNTLKRKEEESGCITFNMDYCMFRMSRNDVLYGIAIISITLFAIFNPFR